MHRIRLAFLGAAQNVTGARYLLQTGAHSLLVDCGLYQERDLQVRNWEPFPRPPSEIDAVLLTHAHLDHCGWLPRLVRQGFKGHVYCTPATADITRISLFDAAKVQAEDAAFKKKRHEHEGRKGPHPEVPLYSAEDVEAACALFSSIPYGQTTVLAGDIRATLHDAGHILGSSMIFLELRQNGTERTMLFSGDVGRWDRPILRDPTTFEEADYVIVESTYGNRIHKDEATIPETLTQVVTEANRKGGNVIVPSFAVERTQELLYYLRRLFSENKIPKVPVYVDSPMAISITELFRRHAELFDEEMTQLLKRGETPCDFPGLVMTRSVEESKAINEQRGTAIIIAGSGMCTGGRIKHHLANNIERPESIVLFIGYQAVGTLGRRILEGEKEVRILGQVRKVRARIEKINGFSGHADRNELMRWLSALKNSPRHVYVTHGEPEAARSLADLIVQQKGWQVSIPAFGEEVEIL
ncbi:MAG: MBL fold metallo-hydrolase [Kiritimatiellae bacterium]|nr:MBL fold metallo-hydrolase [Kiritimatiellia bacterium]